MGIGLIIAGALQGAGNGITMQGQSDIAERREKALEQLRSQNNINEINTRGAVQDQVNAREDKRKFAYTTAEIPLKTQSQITVDANRGRIQSARDVQKFNFDTRLAYIKGNIDRNNDAASIRLRDQLSNGDIKQIVPSKDGTYWGIRADGSKVPTGVTVPEKDLVSAGAEGDASLLGGRGPRAGATPSPSASPAADPADSVDPTTLDYNTPAIQGVRNQSFGAGAFGTSAPAAAVAGRGNTYTIADLRAVAGQPGMDTAKAREWFRSQGYKFTK